MKVKSNWHQASILTKRLTSKVIKNYILTFFILLILLFSILCPVLIKNSLQTQNEYASFIAKQYNQLILSSQSTTQSLINTPELNRLLTSYSRHPSAYTKSKIDEQLQNFLSTFSKVKYCMIENEDGVIFESFTNADIGAKELFLSSDYYLEMQDKTNVSYYSSFFPPELFSCGSNSFTNHTFFVSRKLTLGNKPYIFTVFYSVDDCLSNSNTFFKDVFSDYAVITQNNDIIYATSSENSKILESGRQITKSDTRKPFCSSLGLYYKKNISTIGWNVVTYSSWPLFLNDFFLIMSIVLLFYILPPLFFYYNIAHTTRKYLEPLTTLSKCISGYSAGQSLTLDIHTGDEIEQLSATINQMIKKINNQIEDIRRKEHENYITQYTLLATQIDPHFIYNSLNIISIMARQSGQSDIIEVNTALGKILRERFSTKTSIFETIENCLDTIRQYHTIMKYRYKNSVQININAETHAISEKIPKNLLIPIIENAYYHGLTKEDGDIFGSIDISIYTIDDEIVIEISDDGTGIPQEKLTYLLEHNFQTMQNDRTHIGLSNVYERLSYIYHDRFSIHVDSTLGFGTTFSITIPKYDSSYEFSSLYSNK